MTALSGNNSGEEVSNLEVNSTDELGNLNSAADRVQRSNPNLVGNTVREFFLNPVAP